MTFRFLTSKASFLNAFTLFHVSGYDSKNSVEILNFSKIIIDLFQQALPNFYHHRLLKTIVSFLF